MATVYKQIQQGDSLTFGMIFQGGYDTTRIQHLQLHLHDLLVGDLEDATEGFRADGYIPEDEI